VDLTIDRRAPLRYLRRRVHKALQRLLLKRRGQGGQEGEEEAAAAAAAWGQHKLLLRRPSAAFVELQGNKVRASVLRCCAWVCM
jgi:hypothetical protein